MKKYIPPYLRRIINRKILFKYQLTQTKKRSKGSIKLFAKDFQYHNGLAFHNTYEEIFEKRIYQFVPENNESIILDCGANMGISLLFFSRMYPNAQIIAFEPDETVLPVLEENIRSYEMTNVQLHRAAVWTEETSLEFYTDNGLGGRIGRQFNNKNPSYVNALRLRDYLHQPIEMLKIDIEGPELEIIKDCEDLLKNVNHLFVEYHSILGEEQHLDDLLNILKHNGFRYHLKESFSQKKPFMDNYLINEKFDMAINVFAKRLL